MKKIIIVGAMALGLASMPIRCKYDSKLTYESHWEFGTSAAAHPAETVKLQPGYSTQAKFIINDAWDRMRAEGAKCDYRAREAIDHIIDENHDGHISAILTTQRNP